MTVELQDGTNFDGLFDLLGKLFFSMATNNTAVGTTMPAEIEDALDAFHNRAALLGVDGVEDPLTVAADVVYSNGLGVQQLLAQYAQNLMIAVVNADAGLLNPNLTNCLQELIDQMIDNSESVDASTVAATPAAGGSNYGNGTIVVSTKRGDGLVQENILAEVITLQPNADGFGAILSVTSEPRKELLAHDWPGGSGLSSSLASILPSAGLLENGDFEDEDDVANVPDDWIVVVGTIGTTLKMTDVEVQTITIASTPTSGHYLLHWTDPNSDAWTTIPLAYNATASEVQAALRQIPGLESVTVTSTGTSPNYVHTVTFIGMGGNVNQFTATNNLDTGSVTPATSSAGTGQVFQGGKAVEIDSDGAELTQIKQRLTTLTPSTAYALNLWGRTDSVPAAGVITIDLVDGAGSVIADDQGTNNSFTFNAADLVTGSWKTLDTLVTGDPVFRTPETLPAAIYIRLRVTTAISNTSSVYLDGFAMQAMTELYAGGPMAAAFTGSKPWRATDTFTITTTNNRAGAFQEWFHRVFDMASRGLLLPSDTGGSETIDDALIA